METLKMSELARRWDVDGQTLMLMHMRNFGPRGIRSIGVGLRYDLPEVEAFERACYQFVSRVL